MSDEDAGKPDDTVGLPHPLMATTTTSTVSTGEPRRLPAAWPAGFTFELSPWRLVTLSMLTLFLELALIRWTAANNVHLANIPNFVLLASFLGIGVGFLLARSSRESVPPGPGHPRGPGRVRAHLPGEARHPARPPRVRGPLGAPSGVAVGEPPGDLRAGGPRDGRSRPGLGPDLRAVQATRRLPLRHHRQHRRDRAVLGAFLRRAPAHRLGGGGGRVVRGASRAPGSGGGSGS